MKSVLLSLLFVSAGLLAQPKVLMVGTSQGVLGETGKPTGVWLSELTHAYDKFEQAGVSVSFASIDGRGFPLDPGSLNDMDSSAKDFLLSPGKRALLSDENVLSLTQAKAQNYDAIYLIGGHGVMWDFKGNQNLDSIIASTYQSGGVVAAVCHGIAGLLTVADDSGSLLIDGKKITGFSDEEEAVIALTQVVPFSLEQGLKKAGAVYSQTYENFGSYAVTDGRIVTGQNPASATAVAQQVVTLLK